MSRLSVSLFAGLVLCLLCTHGLAQRPGLRGRQLQGFTLPDMSAVPNMIQGSVGQLGNMASQVLPMMSGGANTLGSGLGSGMNAMMDMFNQVMSGVVTTVGSGAQSATRIISPGSGGSSGGGQ